MEGEVSSLARSLGISGSLGCYYAGGAFHQCSGDDVSLLSPVSGELLASTGGCSATDVDAAVQAASACFQSGTWSGLSGKERGVWLKKLAIAVEAKKSDLMRLEAINVGRPIFEMEGDLADTVAFLEFNAGMAEKLDARQGIVLDAPEGFEISMRYDAAGVAACILPFNWPLINVVLKLGAALAAGCTVVLKPSEFTPLTTLAFAQICTEVGMPAGVVNVVTGLGATCGAALTQHPQVAVVGFTGSVATGCQIARDAQAHDAAKFVFAEMGGKSAAIVLEDIDEERMVDVVDNLIFGVFIGNGQACSATSRILVQERAAPALIRRLTRAIEAIVIGDNLSPETRLGPLITKRQQDKVLGFVDRALAAGVPSLTGSGRWTPPAGQEGAAALAGGNFVKPVVFYPVDPQHEVWTEEIFGPVVCVRTFGTDEEAVQLANDSQYGLAGAVLTNDGDRAQKICEQLKVGCAWINCIQPMFPNTVWGGPGRSSIGRELGDFSLSNFLEPKQICNAVGHRGSPLGWYPSAAL